MTGRMMVADDLDASTAFHLAVAVMKMETVSLPVAEPGDCCRQVAVVISGHYNRFANSSQTRQQSLRSLGRRAIVNQIAEDDEMLRAILCHETAQAGFDQVHAPHRDEAARHALTDLVSEMQVRYRQPALPLMKKSQPPIQDNLLGNKGLAGRKRRHRAQAAGEIIACLRRLQSVCQRLLPMPRILSTILLVAGTLFLVSCATETIPTQAASVFAPKRYAKVRTTAYSHNEGSGSRNALGRRLSSGGIRSAASDWSRFPLGTRFRVVETGEEYVIDDYGGALVGTSTIDLYKSPGAMRRWGVRHIDIDVLTWGSEAESLRVLRPRQRARVVRRMIASIEKKENEKKKKG